MPNRGRKIVGKSYPRPHSNQLKFELSLHDSGKNDAMIPLLMYDEGLGDPANYNAHPEHASFAEYQGVNCYPESRVNNMFVHISASMMKHCWDTDKVEEVVIGAMPIYTAFKEKLDAKDEVSTATVKSVLGLQYETTDRQAYPLWGGTKLDGDILEVGTAMPGMTANTNMENVSFAFGTYLDATQYLTIGPQMRALTGGGRFKWRRVKRRNAATWTFRRRVKGRVKRLNEYTFCGVLIYLPQSNEHMQLCQDSDTSTGNHIQINSRYFYNEWNTDFDMTRV